ncbi:amino acid adenylation [Calothrix brevissima NIES-22]|nr:amino acid adenylation [Calothrix brevissima NIES-22]
MSDIDKSVAALSSEEELALFHQLLRSKGKKRQYFPLSFAQSRLWFLNQWETHSSFYNISGAVHLIGSLNIAALEQSINEIVRRHEILRTNFVTVEGEAVQAIAPSLSLTLSVINLQNLPEVERMAEALRLCHSAAQQPFDLAQEPLLRITLLQLGAAENVLQLTMHHIISDGWSMEILMREVAIIYSAFSQGQLSPLAELPIQYKDFAKWQQQWLQGELLETQLAYWQQQLNGHSPVLHLPTDRPRTAIQSFQGASQFFYLSPELTQALKQLSQQEDVTLFMTLLAAFKTLLYRYTFQEDILVGSPIANRHRSELEDLIGFFVNTLVLRTNLSDNPSFRELLGRVKQVALGAYSHQDLPFEYLVNKLQLERDLSHNPLFQVMFVLQNPPSQEFKLPGLSLRFLEQEQQTAKFDLTLSMQERDSGIQALFEYKTDLFDAATISRMVGHFQTLLESIIVHSNQKLTDLAILTEAERHQLLFEWNHTQVNYPQDKCINQLFEAQVELIPDAIAVVFEQEQLTYRQLNTKANQLANYLKTLGIKPDVLVGICLERSLEMVIAILAILKAGGAYVPLDPAYPQERLAFILQDTQISVLLTQQEILPVLPKHPIEIVCLDRDWEVIAKHSQDNPVSNCTVKNLAYVIYTSGSTGQPKGVLIEHRNVTRLFDAVQSWFNFNSEDVWILFHSIAFDFSVWELWGALLYGGRLVIVPQWLTRSPEAFYNLLSEQQVTVLNQTPSAFRQLIALEESLGTTQELALRLVIFGGEALDIHSLKPWFERHGEQFPQLVNMYGITETTVHVTYRPLTMGDLNQGLGSVIGCPIPDLQVYLLDQYQQPVPIGVPGEMYIGGAGLARGYLHRPELTREKFIPHPFSNQANARLYRSGDIGRYLPNGDIEYLGRIDQQVKIRGFRIELGEIETMLTQHPAVRETLVLARQDATGNQQLVAYVVPSQQPAPTTSQLRNFLQQQLPEFMLPAFFIILAELPLTANGKVDRQSLPIPDTTRPELDEAFVAPRTTPEKILAEIWADILGLEQVGIYDNFFALGGDSIRSIQVRSQAEKRGFYFSLPQLFKYQTIHELVQNITENEADTTITTEIPAFSLICEPDRQQLPDDIEDAYPLTQLQMGMLFHSEYSLDTPTYHNVSSYHLQAPFNLQYFQVAVQQLASRHPVLRTSFELSKFTEPLQLVHQVVTIPLQVEDIRHLSVVEQEKVLSNWLETEKRSLFDWTKASLLRFCIHRRSAETFQLTLTEHHAILDGWSVASLLTDLFEKYFSLLKKSADLLKPSPAVKFQDFVALEREAIASDVQQRYWMEKLQDSTQTMLPRLPGTYQGDSGSHEVPISPAVSQGLLQLAQSLKVPVKTVLLAAHLRVLSLLSGQSDVVTGLVTNGRSEVTDGERVLGLFLNSLPLRLQFPGGTWTDLVKNVFETEQELLPHRRYPLAELQRVLGRQSLFETAFNFNHFHVYQNLLNLDYVKVLDITSFERTNFTLSAKFSQNPSASQIHLCLDYECTILGEEQIKQIGDYYARTLSAIAFQPESRYETYSLLSVEEQHQLLVEWNNTKTDYPQNQCIHQLFEAQVQLTPDAIAVVFADQQLTYNELNARANQLAHHLQALGVEPEVMVGIYLERSVEMIIAILGILKAGGAYVPLDPTYPQERLEFILQDTQLTVLLTQQPLREKLPQHQAQVVCLDTSWSGIFQQSQQNPVSQVKVDNLAYIIYTSGSTGQPKGVEITHQNLVHSTSDRLVYYSEPITNFLLLSPFIFDSSVAGIFWTLCQGGALILPAAELQLQLIQLIELISQHQISHTLCLPSFYKLILEQAQPQQLISLQTVIVAGESCSPELVQLHYQLLPHTSLFNEYGPTEGTVWSSVYNCESYHSQSNVPIGRPIANTQIYLLDIHQQPVPIGVPGELYIGGDGLARGYLNRPELTAQKFISNPFEKSKLYKTGDLARYLPDGNIEFLGRIDEQVKIRGFRLEIGEIEAILAQNPDVLQTVVIARENHAGNQSLVGYIVPKPGKVPNSSELRDFLKQKLPDYMLPSAFVILEALPLTPNGKVNRQALPAPEQNRSTLKEVYIAPRTKIEELLAKIWTQILGIEQIGIHDNFFDLGGNSLLITRLVVLLRKTFQIELPLRSLLEMPTIAELAPSIEIAQTTGASTIVAKTVVNLTAEAVLDPTIIPASSYHENNTEPTCILLTGATGFIGAFLLNELLQQTHADIYCLVRASHTAEGKERIKNSLQSYLLWDESQSSRIIPVVGDLSQPLLGLPPEQFHTMAELIDVIYHNGAWVHHTSPYSVLKAANVLGTQEVLRLASQIKVKPVHFISTTSVFASAAESGMLLVGEQDSLDNYQIPTDGYSQSKWVAEKLVSIARDRGLPVSIYRLGRVSGHSQTGVFNANDFLYKLIIGCIQLGSIPDVEMIEDIAPVDYLTRAIAHLSKQKESLGKAFHFVNHQPLRSSMLSNLLKKFGYPLQPISPAEWRKTVVKVAEIDPEHALSPILSLLPSSEAHTETSNSAILQFDCQNTLNGLAGTSITCPPVNEQLLSTYLSYLIDKGFLKSPQPNQKMVL